MIRLHRKFFDALEGLSKSSRSRVMDAIDKLQTAPESAGLRRHKVGDFVSLSASMDLRILAWPKGPDLTLVHVDHHDAAYAWGERHSAIINDKSELIALIHAPITTEVIGKNIPCEKRPPDPRFLMLPPRLAEWLSSFTTEDEVLDAIATLAPELQEVALDGMVETNEVHMPSDIVVLDADETLRHALQFPARRWLTFLHPRQRFLVFENFESHVLLRGGPGTGKTITLVHRFAQLLRKSREEGGLPPCFIAHNDVTRLVIQNLLESLGLKNFEGLILSAGDLGRNETGLTKAMSKFSTVLVDEGQDLPRAYLALLLSVLENGADLPPHMIAFDANQALTSSSGEAFARISQLADSFTLTYCYRSTREIVNSALAFLSDLRTRYGGRDFKVSHEISASRDLVSSKLTAVISGPQVRYRIENETNLPRTVSDILVQLRKKYKNDELAVIVITQSQEGTLRDRLFMDRGMCLVLNPSEAKGREFFAGVVIDGIMHNEIDPAMVSLATYRSLSGLYVALTRFRDSVEVISISSSSPFQQQPKP